jgi:peptidoglycan/xylan/chitin deacetylase (PgdA/CDA1 family)
MNLLVVNYHYYGKQKYNGGIYPISPEFFSNQIAVISKTHRFISQSELINYIEQQDFPNGDYCLITFDDGLKQQMDAFKYLVKNNIPAVFYLPVQPLVEKNVLSVHKLHFIRANIDDEKLLTKLKNNTTYQYDALDKANANIQYKYDNDLAREIKYQLNFKINQQEKQKFINTTFNEIYPDEMLFSENFYMNEFDIQELSSSGMLGSHGYEHVPLSQYKDADQDIMKSIEYLTKLTGRQIQSFSYPYGSRSAVDESIAVKLENTSIRFALTMWRGINDFNKPFNPMLLNRVDTNDAPGGKINSIN